MTQMQLGDLPWDTFHDEAGGLGTAIATYRRKRTKKGAGSLGSPTLRLFTASCLPQGAPDLLLQQIPLRF